jgi:hypothetical protein
LFSLRPRREVTFKARQMGCLQYTFKGAETGTGHVWSPVQTQANGKKLVGLVNGYCALMCHLVLQRLAS